MGLSHVPSRRHLARRGNTYVETLFVICLLGLLCFGAFRLFGDQVGFGLDDVGERVGAIRGSAPSAASPDDDLGVDWAALDEHMNDRSQWTADTSLDAQQTILPRETDRVGRALRPLFGSHAQSALTVSTLGGSPKLVASDKSPQPIQTSPRVVTDFEVLDGAAALASRQRERYVELLAAGYGRYIPAAETVAPEDLSSRMEGYRVRPPPELVGTDAWAVEVRFVEELQQIAEREGFDVAWEASPPTNWTYWGEDAQYYHLDGTISALPALGVNPVRVVSDARQERFGDQFLIPATLGAVHQGGNWDDGVQKALQDRVPYRRPLTYVEGGDKIVGALRNGEPYVVIGEDSVAVSRAQLSKEIGRPVTEAELRLAFSKDFGLPVERVIYSEMPADFHIDMGMAAWTPGVVLVNDYERTAEMVAEHALAEHAAQEPSAEGYTNPQAYLEAHAQWQSQGEWLRGEVDAMLVTSQMRAELEGLAARDLERAGLEVVRVPGRFPRVDNPWEDGANFINGEGGTNQTGGQYFITGGGPPWAEASFVEAVAPLSETPVQIYFLDPGIAGQNLAMMGGIRCRTGDVPLTPLSRPQRPPPSTPSSPTDSDQTGDPWHIAYDD